MTTLPKDIEERFDELLPVNPEMDCDGLEPNGEYHCGRSDWMGYNVLCCHDDDCVCSRRMAVVKTFLASELAHQREEMVKAVEQIWSKYHINNFTDDGFRDSAEVVVEKFMAALKGQIDYFARLLSVEQEDTNKTKE